MGSGATERERRQKETFVLTCVRVCVLLPLKYGIGTVVRDKGDEEEEEWEKPEAPCWSQRRQKQKQTHQNLKTFLIKSLGWFV